MGFDWALAAQLAYQAVAGAAGVSRVTASPSSPSWAAVSVLLAPALIALATGEGLRRGLAPLRRWQIAGCAVLGVAGWLSLPWSWQQFRPPVGRYAVSLAIILTLPPWIAWRLSLPGTAEWFRRVTPAAASARHNRRWLAQAVIGSLVGGILVACSQRAG